jgi:hypothetical protein
MERAKGGSSNKRFFKVGIKHNILNTDGEERRQ